MNINRIFKGDIIRRFAHSKYFLISIAGIFLLLCILYFSKGYILQRAIESVNAKLEARHYTAIWDEYKLQGFNKLFLKHVQIKSDFNNDEINVDSLSLRVRILPALFKKLRLKGLECKSIYVQHQFTNEENLPVQKTKIPENTSLDRLTNINFSELANKYIHRFMVYVPVKVYIGSFKVRLLYGEGVTSAELNKLTIRKGNIQADVIITSDGKNVRIPISGKLNKSKSIVEIGIVNENKGLIPIPLLKDKFGITAGFDSLYFRVNFSNRKRHQVNINGNIHFSNLELNGERIASNTIIINHFQSDFILHLGENFFEVDSTSNFSLNKIRLNPYIRYSRINSPVVDFKILPVTWDADEFFTSLPEGMFTSVTGLRAAGQLSYFLNFSVDLNNPEALVFDTKLTPVSFKIMKYGVDNYPMINGSFYHRIYYKGQEVAAFMVGPENPDFTQFDQISPFLRSAVMTSEDGNFFYHKGFNPNAFRESIATDIREMRFARGGSTISMQLVKNVFLTRNKTVARKIEEALIVWLIETYHLVPKQRMYEIYLNIIEWGPGIYGINQASHFYFNKRPSELDLQESIFLASIVPHPKWYKYTFESNGVPKPFFDYYFSRIEELMVHKKFIEPSDTIGITPLVYLNGPASEAFVLKDTVVVDSSVIEDLKIIPGEDVLKPKENRKLFRLRSHEE